MKSKLFLIVPLLFILTACDDSYFPDYPTESFTLENNLHEQYLIKYTEQTGFPDNSVYFVIYDGENRIAGYGGGDYKNLDKCRPQEILFLCADEDTSLYYLHDGCQRSYLLADGDAIEIGTGETCLSLSRTVRAHWNINDLVETFQTCGYDYESIVSLYDLSE